MIKHNILPYEYLYDCDNIQQSINVKYLKAQVAIANKWKQLVDVVTEDIGFDKSVIICRFSFSINTYLFLDLIIELSYKKVYMYILGDAFLVCNST